MKRHEIGIAAAAAAGAVGAAAVSVFRWVSRRRRKSAARELAEDVERFEGEGGSIE